MPELFDRISADLKAAMKARDAVRVAVLRLLVNDLKNAGIEKKGRKGFTEEVDSPAEYLSGEEASQVLRSALKKRREAAELYEKGGREELVKQEEAEAEVIQDYLPKQLGAAELEKLVREAVEQTGADSPAQMGAVIKAVMAKAGGRADGKTVSESVRRLLGA